MIGEDYQAVIPEMLSEEDRETDLNETDTSICTWMPPEKLSNEKGFLEFEKDLPSTAEGAVEAAEGALTPDTPDIFSNSLIRKEILKNLAIPDLLTASLVCKEWRMFCRETLREDRRCLAKIQGTRACHDLKELSSLLETSDGIPFNGLSIAIHPSEVYYSCYPIQPKDVLEIGSKILAAIGIKYLWIRVDGLQDYYYKCVCVYFVGEIFRKTSESLEELRFIGNDVMGEKNKYLQWLGIDEYYFLKLPNVRLLEFPSRLCCLEYFRRDYDFTVDSAVNKLIAVSPRLEEIRGMIVPEHLEFLLSQGVSQLVKEFHMNESALPLDALHQFALTNPKLHQLKLAICCWGDASGQALEVAKLLLESSRKSLKMLVIENEDLGFMISQWPEIPVFQNVEHFRLGFCEFLILPYDATAPLRKLEWFKHFPNLKQVCIDYDRWAEFVFGEALAGLPGEYSCNTVAKIIFTIGRCGLPYDDSSDLDDELEGIQFDLFKTVFPNVKSCLVEQSSEMVSIRFSELWSAWPDLEEICIFGLSPINPCYDNDVMGISEEESHFLWEDFEEGFDSLELVPIKPNIMSFQKLKKLALQLDHNNDRAPHRSAFISPNVCKWMASRIPGLVFEVDTHCRRFGQEWQDQTHCGSKQEVDHLLPFAKLVRQNFGPYF